MAIKIPLAPANPFDQVYRWIMPDGELRFMRSRWSHVFAPEGHPVRSLGTVQDITLLELSRQEQQAREASLRQSASVFRHAREGIFITDADGNIQDVNAAFSQITGYQPEHVIGLHTRLLKSGMHDRGHAAGGAQGAATGDLLARS